MEDHFAKASLSPYNNLWWNIHDFTPNSSEGPNWSILGECYKVQDFIEPIEEKIELSLDRSSVPLTIGSRNRVCDETTLVLVFYDELQQSERAKRVLKACFEQGLELVKSRCLSMDVSGL